MEWGLILPNTVALAAVAVLGYLFGRRGRTRPAADPNQMRRELHRAKTVVAELQRIAHEVRQGLASHHCSVMLFKNRLTKLEATSAGIAGSELFHEAERLLQPTAKLAGDMASAYDQLRRHSSMLTSFTNDRTDPLTGLSNRRALSESITSMLAIVRRYQRPFAIAVFDIDNFQQLNDEGGRAYGDELLREMALLIEQTIRETDVVARSGGDEFIVVMAETSLEASCVMARRIRRKLEAETKLTASIGLITADGKEDADELLARAEDALSAAKADGGNCIFQHNGQQPERISATQFTTADDLSSIAELIA